MSEALTYEFDELKPDSAVVTAALGEARGTVYRKDGPDATLANIRNQLRNSAQYIWAGFDDAATWCVDNKVNLDEALVWADRSIQQEERFENLTTKARILEALNRTTEAKAVRAKSMEIANVVQLYIYGRQLQTHKQKSRSHRGLPDCGQALPRPLARATWRWPGRWRPTAISKRPSRRSAPPCRAPRRTEAGLENLVKRLENKEDING